MTQNSHRLIGLTIAGFDPSSGAGITADLKVFAAHGIYGMAAVTALTVQSTQGVRRSKAVSAALLTETLDCLREDVTFAGVKIGMLATAENVRATARWLGARGPARPVVLDPVLNSSSGAALLSAAGLEAIRDELLSRVGWITPNWAELRSLTGMEVRGREDLPAAIRRLQESAGSGALNVVVTGGDQATGGDSNDFLITAGGEEFHLAGKRVNTTSTHGTGCAFSTALLCELIAGQDSFTACSNAKAFVSRGLQMAYPIGRGRGPLNLFCK